jgi:hypothetical protein
MRQRFAIIITITVVIVLLVVLNAASYVSREKPPETELAPDRSTFNAGATGTLALYDLLAESGRQVMRWRDNMDALLNADGSNRPSTFIVIGRTRVPFEKNEARDLLRWVERGGRLVIVDRRPDARLLPVSEAWTLSTTPERLPVAEVHADNTKELTAGVAPVLPSQPTVLTRNVQAIQPSLFASAVNISTTNNVTSSAQSSPTPSAAEDEDEADEDQPPPAMPTPSRTYVPPPPPPKPVYVNRISPAPVAHFEERRGALLVDYPHGAGRIIILSDPFIIANNGLRLADNLQLALNTIAGSDGIIAFDEYHQGHAATGNQLIAYFSGTPIIWMVAQAALIVLVILWTRGRRFARPLPLARVDRRSSLEFVASMAELQQRARAYDLAIENIYTRLRRVLVRYAGVSHNTPRSEIAARVAARSGKKINAARLEGLMNECEAVVNGAPVETNKALELVKQLRMVERILGLRTRSREARQAAEGLQQTTI